MTRQPIGLRLLKLIQNVNEVSSHPGLNAINYKFAFKLDVDASNGDDYAGEVVARIASLLPCTIQEHSKIGQIRTALGEAKIFYRLGASVAIRRVRESRELRVKSPDFVIEFPSTTTEPPFAPQALSFPTEIKAPDFVGGDAALNDHMFAALSAKIAVEQQVLAGQGFGVAEHSVTPWGGHGRTMAQVTERLIDKLRQNIKREQLRGGGILAVDLPKWFLPLASSPENESRKEYLVDPGSDVTASGILWHVAFGRQNDPLKNFDGSDGQPLGRTGIMHDYPEIRLLTFFINGRFLSFVRPLSRSDPHSLATHELVDEFSSQANDEEDCHHATFHPRRW